MIICAQVEKGEKYTKLHYRLNQFVQISAFLRPASWKYSS